MCLRVCLCDRWENETKKAEEGEETSPHLREHLLFVQEKQFASRAFRPLLQHKGEVLDAFDRQLLLQRQEHVLK